MNIFAITLIEVIVIISSIAIVVSVIITSILKRKKGQNSCGGGCGSCPFSSRCKSKNK